MFEWKGLLFSVHSKVYGSAFVKTVVSDEEGNVMRCAGLGRIVCTWNGGMVSQDRNGSYSLWDATSWKPTIHDRYPKRVRDAICAWITISRRRGLPLDMTLSIASRIVGGNLYL